MEKRDNRTDEELLTTCGPGEEAGGVLYERYLGLIYSISNHAPPHLREECFLAGTEGFNKAMDNWNPNNGSTFRSYAYIKTYGAVMDELRRQGTYGMSQIGIRRGRRVSMFSIDYVDKEGNESSLIKNLASYAPTPEEVAIKNESCKEFSSLGDYLGTEQERELLRAYFVEGRTLKEIAEDMEVTESRACQVKARVAKRLGKNPEAVKILRDLCLE